VQVTIHTRREDPRVRDGKREEGKRISLSTTKRIKYPCYIGSGILKRTWIHSKGKGGKEDAHPFQERKKFSLACPSVGEKRAAPAVLCSGKKVLSALKPKLKGKEKAAFSIKKMKESSGAPSRQEKNTPRYLKIMWWSQKEKGSLRKTCNHCGGRKWFHALARCPKD